MKFNYKILSIWILGIILCSTSFFYEYETIMNIVIGTYLFLILFLMIYLFLLSVFNIDFLGIMSNKDDAEHAVKESEDKR